jgi:hypothetical protein
MPASLRSPSGRRNSRKQVGRMSGASSPFFSLIPAPLPLAVRDLHPPRLRCPYTNIPYRRNTFTKRRLKHGAFGSVGCTDPQTTAILLDRAVMLDLAVGPAFISSCFQSLFVEAIVTFDRVMLKWVGWRSCERVG